MGVHEQVILEKVSKYISNMNFKVCFGICLLALTIASEIDARRFGRRPSGGKGGKGRGGKGVWFAKMLCRAFGDESLVDGTSTVKDYCDGVKSEVEEEISPIKDQIKQIFEDEVKPLKDQIKELVETKVGEVKDTIREVCENGDFSGDRKLNRLCQKLQEADDDDEEEEEQ